MTLDTVGICYRTIAESVIKTYENRNIRQYEPSAEVKPLETTRIPIGTEELFQFGSLRKYGTITRGGSFGNRQNLLVNSSLNLQIEGAVSENLNVSAVITDQNIPYQPDGNTQQIRDFDNVFIKLYNEKFAVTAGDIVLQNESASDYFLRFYKNVQGLQATYSGNTNEWKHRAKISGAISKGKFASTVLAAIDGLSGPYKLRGSSGERFIVVLANSEKVFLDGVRLDRGFDRDYVIDYNLGEITFSNHIVITQFSRIRVDFEYAEQFYSRFNFSASQEVSNDKVKLFAGYYREQANPNTNFGFIINADDRAQLQGIGDNVDQAFVTGFDTVAFDANSILYQLKDTVDMDENMQMIFEYATAPNLKLSSITFSEVGFGNGDYILRQNTSNGRIYRWISPRGGVSQGNYRAGAFIPLPNSRQMINVGGEVRLSSYETLFSEGAFSNTDLNLYSDRDDNDNHGIGYYGGIRTIGRTAFLRNYRWEGSMAMEYNDKDFTFIDRYRPIEFDRNWDLNTDTLEKAGDVILLAKASLKKNDRNKVEYMINWRNRQRSVNGWQHGLILNQQIGNVRLLSANSYLTNDQRETSSTWVQSRSDISFHKFFVTPGYAFQLDENTLSEQDSVINSRMHFRANEFYLTNKDSSRHSYRITYTLRKDNLPVNGRIEPFLLSKNLNARYSVAGKRSNIFFDFNYRSIKDQIGLSTAQSEIVNGRLGWWGNYLRKHIQQNLSFSTGNSRELRREFVYLPVRIGEGTHTWRDTDGDGVQNLNEFFEAINPDERDFVKIFTPTDDYITSFQTFYTHTIDAKMPLSWRRRRGFIAFFSKFSMNINLNINFRITSNRYIDRINPFGVSLTDENLLSTQDDKRYTFFYNRNGRGFAGDLSHQTSDAKQLLTQGFEFRERENWITNMKVDLSEATILRVTSTLGSLVNNSDFLDSRNFKIISSSCKPQLIWKPTNSLRLIGSFELESKRNELLETSVEESKIQTYQTELTWNKVSKGSLRSSFAWVRIDFTGDPTTYLAYLLLNALQPGFNQTWQISWNQKISKGMQLSLLYNGRKSEKTTPIHSGNVQLTAFL